MLRGDEVSLEVMGTAGLTDSGDRGILTLGNEMMLMTKPPWEKVERFLSTSVLAMIMTFELFALVTKLAVAIK